MGGLRTTTSLLRPYHSDMTWQRRAECGRKRADGSLLYDPELWFNVGTTGPAREQIDAAKAVCFRCPVIESCREWALAVQEYGVHGALDEDERRVIRRERARATREEVRAS